MNLDQDSAVEPPADREGGLMVTIDDSIDVALPGMKAPIRRAFATAGISRIAHLRNHREFEIANMYGVGPRCLDRLRVERAARGMSFAPEPS